MAVQGPSKVSRVHPREVTALLRELRRLYDLGEAATYEDWLAFHERKADMLGRIAASPGELVDVERAADVAAEAQSQVEEMRARTELPDGHPACRGGSCDRS